MIAKDRQDESQPEAILLLDDSSNSTRSRSRSSSCDTAQPLAFLPSRIASLSTEELVSPFEDDDMFALVQTPTYDSEADFGEFDFEIPLRWYRRAWSFVLGMSGFFDILAYLEPSFRSSYEETCSIEPGLGDSLLGPLLEIDAVAPWYCSTWETFLDRLKDYNVVIAFAFSLLWFLHSYSKAREAYYNKFVDREDRMQLFPSKNGYFFTETNEIKRGQTYGNAWVRRQKLKFNSRHAYYRRILSKALLKKKKFNARNAYYRRILSRTLLLPVGFYVIVFHLIRGLMRGQWLYRELLIKPTNETVSLTIQDPNEYVTIEINEAHAKMSTAYAIFLYLKHRFLKASSLAIAEFLKNNIPRLKRKLVFRAFRNPRNFMRQLRSVLQYVRWTKYIVPLLIKLNKINSNIFATLKKRRQYRITKKKRRKQRALQRRKSLVERERDAATLIQSVWRSHQKYEKRRSAISSLKDKRQAAAMKIQLAYRRTAFQARIRNSRRKRRELFCLEKRRKSELMNDDDRRRLFELQDEFMAEAKKTLNKRLLIRPNTKISFIWNGIFVFCLLVEISQKALKPWLALPKAKRTDVQEYKPIRLFLAESSTPIPVAETEACKDVFKKKSALRRLFYNRHHKEQPTRDEVVSAFIDFLHTDPDYGFEGLEGFEGSHNDTCAATSKPKKIKWRCREPISTWRDGYRDMVSILLRPDPVSEWSICQPKNTTLVGKIISPFRRKKRIRTLPWYCEEPYSKIHDWYQLVTNFAIDQMYLIMCIICFIDVFVKFFTGDLDPLTGGLNPKPFFERWIFPGILYQLLINPFIGSFSVVVFKTIDWVSLVGPVRVLRWCIAVLFPIAYVLKILAIIVLEEAEFDKQLAQYTTMLWEVKLRF